MKKFVLSLTFGALGRVFEHNARMRGGLKIDEKRMEGYTGEGNKGLGALLASAKTLLGSVYSLFSIACLLYKRHVRTRHPNLPSRD